MDRPLEVGDFVTISLDHNHYDYVVRNIIGLDIYISTSEQPERLSRLYPLNGNYVIDGAEDLTYLIEFSPSPDILTGNFYLDIDLLTSFSSQDLETFCQINHPYVQKLCGDDNLWTNKIIQDFGQLSLSLKPSAVGLKEYYYDFVNFPTHVDLIQENHWSSQPRRGRGRQERNEARMKRMFISPREQDGSKKIVEDYIEDVARKGEVHFLNALLEQGFRPNGEYANIALRYGQLPILTRLSELGVYPTNQGIFQAISLSDTNVFEWIKQNIPITHDEPGKSYATSTHQLTWRELANWGAGEGKLVFLEWLEKQGILPDKVGANNAVLNNHPETIEWLKSRGIISELKSRKLPQTWEEALENIDLITSDQTVEDRYTQPELLRISRKLEPDPRTVRRVIRPEQLRRDILDHFNLPHD